jgi:hypothetical protein
MAMLGDFVPSSWFDAVMMRASYGISSHRRRPHVACSAQQLRLHADASRRSCRETRAAAGLKNRPWRGRASVNAPFV